MWIYVKYSSLLSWLHLIILKCKPYRPSLVSYFQHHRDWKYTIPSNSCWLIFKIKEAYCPFMIPLFVSYYFKLSFSSIWFPSNPTRHFTSEWIHICKTLAYLIPQHVTMQFSGKVAKHTYHFNLFHIFLLRNSVQ